MSSFSRRSLRFLLICQVFFEKYCFYMSPCAEIKTLNHHHKWLSVLCANLMTLPIRADNSISASLQGCVISAGQPFISISTFWRMDKASHTFNRYREMFSFLLNVWLEFVYGTIYYSDFPAVLLDVSSFLNLINIASRTLTTWSRIAT